MKTPILGSAYVARSVNAADNRMINLFPEIIPEGGKEAAFLQRCAGLRLVATVGEGPVRGLWTFGDYLYVASGGKLYRVDGNFAVTELGLINGSGPVSMVDNGTQLFVACNPDAFIYNTSTGVFAQITDPDFPGAVTVGYLDGYFVFNQPNSQRFWVTSLNDGTQIDPLDFASAEGNPDNVVALNVNHREVWLFGTNTIEVWYNAGLADFPLARIAGAFMEVGCAAPYSVAKLDNSVFWLGADARGNGIVYRNNGYNGQRISTHAVEWQIQQYGVLNDAIGYSYQQDGHSYYMLTFPTANVTWCYDVATSAWHERAGWNGVQFVRHRSNCQANFNGEVVVGDWMNGLVYAFDPEVYSDNNEVQRWLRSWRALPPGQNNLRRTAQHTLQLDCESGFVGRPAPRELVSNPGKPFVNTNGWTGSGNAVFSVINNNIDLSSTGGIAYIYTPFTSSAGQLVTLTFGYVRAGASGFRIKVGTSPDASDVYTFAGATNTTRTTTFESPGGVLYITFSLLSGTAFVSSQLTIASAKVMEQPNIDPQVMLRWSDDGGHTWSNEHWASMGKIGEYGKRVFWRRLGMTLKLRDRVYELSGTDPAKIAIMGAEVLMSPTRA